MVQTTTAVKAANTNTEVAKAPKKVELLKSVMNADSVKEQFRNALGKHADTFVASVIDLYNGDTALQQCNPKQVVMEALKAAVLHLPINKALGYAYIIPYKNSKKDEHGSWIKVYEPTFQMGYKGYIQLAMRTGEYKTLNADAVYEGELRKVNKLTGEIAFDGERKSDKIVGYFCYFELLNGFSKTLYMTVEQIAIHAKRYSKGLVKYDDHGNKQDVSVQSLMALADLPMNPDNKNVGWLGNFHGMAIKTVIRNLLSKYGYLSIEMQNAIANDNEGDAAAENREIAKKAANAQTMDMADADYEEVGSGGNNAVEQKEINPGF